MKRVLHFTGYRMAVQEWSGNKLESYIYFEPDDQGFELFSAYLRSFLTESVKLLVDLIEEEFWLIQIPLLRGSDRQEVINRKYDKYLHHSKYRFATSQSIEKKKRKQENLLLIGLMNEKLLEPWLTIVEETATPLSGIISLPLLSEQYLPRLKTKSKVIILVSQQVPSNLRQSVFVDTKLVLSRLVPIGSFYKGEYAVDVVQYIESTKNHLISQRIVESSEEIEVHILTNKRHLEPLTTYCAKANGFIFKLHEINELLKKQKIKTPQQQDFSAGLFCNLASKKIVLNHYTPQKQKKNYQQHLAIRALKFCGVAVLAISFTITLSSGMKGWVFNRAIIEKTKIEKNYQAKYSDLSENQIDTSISSRTMRDIVQTVELIQQKYLNSPQRMLVQVSQDMSYFPDLRVKKLDWFVSNYANTKSVEAVIWSKKVNSSSNQNISKLISNKGLFEVVVVEAEFLNFDGDYRYALKTVDDLYKKMSRSGQYINIEILKRPLDIEPSNSLIGEVGKNEVNNPVALLAFRVVREVKHDK